MVSKTVKLLKFSFRTICQLMNLGSKHKPVTDFKQGIVNSRIKN